MIDLKKFKKPEIYKDKNLFINVLWYLINNLFLNSFIPGSKLRIIILNLFGADISKSAYIKPRLLEMDEIVDRVDDKIPKQFIIDHSLKLVGCNYREHLAIVL